MTERCLEIKEKFEWKPFLCSLCAIVFPIAAQNLLATTSTMIDTMMVASLGELSVGALGLCSQYSNLMFSSYFGFVAGGMLFYAQYWGAKDDRGIERAYGLTLTCMMTVAFIFGSMAIFAPNLIMKLYTDKTAIQEIGVEYLRIVGFAYILQIFSMASSSLLRTTEKIKIPMIATIAGVASNIFLNWVFIFGNLGIPALEIRGAAIATLIAAFINVAITLFLSLKANYTYLFHVKNHFSWNKNFVRTYFVKCFPILMNEILIGVGNMIINITLGRQNEKVIAAIAVFRTLEGLIIGFFAGFSNAGSILVGSCIGAGELRKAYERAKRLVYLCSGVILLVNVILLILHNPILRSMSLHDESLNIGTVLLSIFAVVSVIRMGFWIHNDTFRASGETVYGTVLELSCMYFVVLPCVILSGFIFKLPYWAVFTACYIDEPFRYFMMQRHLYSGKWVKPVTEQGKAALPAFQKEMGII